MSKLTPRELVLFRRAAEDAIHACNRNYGPFIDVVAHPLNMLKLVDMAELSNQQKLKLDDQQKRIDAALHVFEKAHNECFDIYDLFFEVEQALKGDKS